MSNHKQCHKCDLPIAFKRLPSGKWCPTNVDGSDHWDICRETRNRMIHPDELRARDRAMSKPVIIGTIKHAYCGRVPPWDDSLGPFRVFTPAEIVDPAVVREIR